MFKEGDSVVVIGNWPEYVGLKGTIKMKYGSDFWIIDVPGKGFFAFRPFELELLNEIEMETVTNTIP